MTTTTDHQPLTDQQIAELKKQTARVAEVFGTRWQACEDFGDISVRTGDSMPGFFTEVFSTSQRMGAEDGSPLADFLIDLVNRAPALLAEVERLRAELATAHAEVAQELRDRSAAINASGGTNNDPLADAIWDTCHRHPDTPATFDDPRRIAQVAYEHIATTITEETAQ